MRTRHWLILLPLLPIYILWLMFAGSAAMLVAMAAFGGDDMPSLRETPGLLIDAVQDVDWWTTTAPVAAVVTASQLVFLLPLAFRTPPREQRPRSLTIALLVAATIGAILAAGFGGILMEVIALTVGDYDAWHEQGGLYVLPLVMLGVGWIAWMVPLLVLLRGIWADRVLGRALGWLMAGTAIELIATIPVDIMVRRRTDCYCATGSFLALGIGVLAAIWLTGPGIVLVIMTPRYRRWRAIHCHACGYPRPKGSTAWDRCPECGAAWGTTKRAGA